MGKHNNPHQPRFKQITEWTNAFLLRPAHGRRVHRYHNSHKLSDGWRKILVSTAMLISQAFGLGGINAEMRTSFSRSEIEAHQETSVLARNEGVENPGGRCWEAVELCGLVPRLWALRYLSR